jgi:alpha-methylacyl-CoA racemase
MAGPLNDLRVVELAGIGPAPFACMLLADLGATVIRIERLSGAGGTFKAEPRYQVTLRGRPALGVDLKSEAGRALVLQMVEQADLLVEGFRPGVTERLGLGPDACLARNPKLVYGRMTGWGQTGPLAQVAGHDINYIALTGALHAIGPKGGAPVPPLNLVGDFGGGSMYLLLGVLAAVMNARTTGRGQVVDAAMVDGAASLMATFFGRHAAGQWVDRRGDNALDGGTPWYTVYETADAKHVAVGAIEPAFFKALAEGIGLDPALAERRDDPATWPALRAEMARLFRTRTRDDWCARLEHTEACLSPVLTLAEAPQHAHNRERGVFVTPPATGVTQPGPAPRFSATPAGAVQPASGNTEDATQALLTQWGVDAARLAQLKADGVLR